MLIKNTSFQRRQVFRQVNFQEDVALHSSRRSSLDSLDSDRQVEDDDDADDDADEKEDDFDDRSQSIASSADHSAFSDDAWIDGTATPVWHRMLHVLNKVFKRRKADIQSLFIILFYYAC